MSASAPPSPRLRVTECSKAFPGVRALDGVSLEVKPGEIRALLGENGAGKSTLGKIVGGVYHLDSGTVEHDGHVLGAIDEAAAGARGIGIVHQEGSLVPQLTIAENVFAGRQPTGLLGVVNRKAMRQQTRELLARLGVALDPAAYVRELSGAQAQVVEIAKALSQDLNLLILDEPTAALTLTETERLFDIVRQLAAQGVAVIYISHRLAEIFQLCHSVTVLKDGRVTGVRQVADTNTDELIRLMVGRDVHFTRDAVARVPGEERLAVEHLAPSRSCAMRRSRCAPARSSASPGWSARGARRRARRSSARATAQAGRSA
jgi:ribose transport system ATP-binding protein/rhamnose transport system ATP-binding protein